MRSRELRTDAMGPKASEGTRLLWAALARMGWSQNRLAHELRREGAPLKIHSGTVNRWLHGHLAPGLEWALVLKRVAGIEPEMWVKSPRRPIVLRLGAAA